MFLFILQRLRNKLQLILIMLGDTDVCDRMVLYVNI